MSFNQIFKKLELQHLLAVIATAPIELFLLPKITGQATTLVDAIVAVACSVLVIWATLLIRKRREKRKQQTESTNIKNCCWYVRPW